MRFYRILTTGIVLGAGLTLGCGEEAGKPMKNMKPGTGQPQEQEMKSSKGGPKPLPPEPPGPQAPPLQTGKQQ